MDEYDEFFSERISSSTSPWASTFQLNGLPLFSVKAQQLKEKPELAFLKEEGTEVIQMMLSGYSGRDIDEEMFVSQFPGTDAQRNKI